MTYVDIEGMSSTLEEMLSHINELQGHIEEYDTSAEASLGESSFRPTVEGNLNGIKNKYLDIVPELEKIKEKITEIMDEYNLRASKVESAGSN